MGRATIMTNRARHDSVEKVFTMRLQWIIQ
jgi:hypothetical protein